MKIIAKNYEEHNQRFVIADDNGRVIDDANGYGYTTAQKAHRAMWYRFNGGKQKMQKRENDKKVFFKKTVGLREFLDEIMEYNVKEIYKGEVSSKDIADWVKEKFNIDIPEEYIYN